MENLMLSSNVNFSRLFPDSELMLNLLFFSLCFKDILHYQNTSCISVFNKSFDSAAQLCRCGIQNPEFSLKNKVTAYWFTKAVTDR